MGSDLIKVMLLYNLASTVNDEEFEKFIQSDHMKSVREISGLKKYIYNRALGAPKGEPKFKRICELHFEDMRSVQEALGSAEAKCTVGELTPKISDLSIIILEPKEMEI